MIHNGRLSIRLVRAGGIDIVTYSDGSQFWSINGIPHRADGPAAIYPDGYQAWYLNGRRHRADGPAVIRPDGTKEFWVNGIRIEGHIQ